MKRRIHLIAAARPNFMKVAPLYHALVREPWADTALVHTGQHYDPEMSAVFLNDLGLPSPHIELGIGSGSHAEQTAGVMVAYEKICLDRRPDWVVVVGDVNSTVACTLAAAKVYIPVAHLEAGLRSRDRTMPEEINRLVTDTLADRLWTPSADADDNLRAEGVAAERIVQVGNIMMDSYELLRRRIEQAGLGRELGLAPKGYGVVTLHRPVNVDDPQSLSRVLDSLPHVAARLPLVFPLHPRTRKRLEEFGLWPRVQDVPGLHLLEPQGYVQFMGLVRQARFVATDSGGVQEETTYLGIPCITLRETTERPVTVTHGSNRLARVEQLESCVDAILAGDWPIGAPPPGWDGHTADRVVADLRRLCAA